MGPESEGVHRIILYRNTIIMSIDTLSASVLAGSGVDHVSL